MKRIPWIIQLLSASALVLVAPACKKKTADTGAGSAGSAMTAGSAGSAAVADSTGPAAAGSGSAGSGSDAGSATAAAPALSDPQIAAIVVAANQVDIDAGN